MLALTAFVLSHSDVAAQGITLRAAIDSAIKNNAAQKRSNLQAAYYKRLARSGADLPQTMVVGEYGQINSSFKDTKFSVTQAVRFPAVYARQRSVLHAEWLDAVASARVDEAELQNNVAYTYFEIVFLEEKLQLLVSIDSVYSEFGGLTEQRLATGGANALDKAAAELHSGEARLQRSEAAHDLAVAKLGLQTLLNTSRDYEPSDRAAALLTPNLATSALSADHPLLFRQRQLQQVDLERQKLERSRMLPDLFLAYNNMSMLGYGADGVLYNRSSRFQSVQAGIGIPLFYGAQHARLSASKIGGQLSEALYQETAAMLESSRKEAWLEYEKNRKMVALLESGSLSSAQLILSTANRQFRAGEIKYSDWASLAAQAIGMKNAYIDARHALNESIIRLNSLHAK
jgi:heavy metal efflux system protein